MDIAARVGLRYLPHAGAATKALLAFQPEGFIAEHRLPAYTRYIITDADTLKRHPAAIRGQGYVFSIEDVQVHASAVSVPIYDRDDRVRASVCVSGPSDRFTDEKREQAPAILAGVCDRISASLGSSIRPGARIVLRERTPL